MNIFKVLANGHGSVNENNISAFLGYLLDPKANHALGYEFLKLFINSLGLDDEEKDEFNIEKHDVHIYYEQRFAPQKNNSEKIKNEIIDIVLLCTKIDIGRGKSNQMINYVTNAKSIEKVFLIENKINKGSITEGQILRQREAFLFNFKDFIVDNKNIVSVYVTPENNKFKEEFKKLEIENSIHLFWNLENEKGTSIKSLLKELIRKEDEILIDPINEYTKYTTKAFIQFIENDFKSEVEEEKEKFKKNVFNNLLEFKKDFRENLFTEDLNLVENFTNFIEMNFKGKFRYQHSKTHPCSVFYKNKKIMSLTRSGKRVILHFVTRNFNSLNAELLIEIFKTENVELQKRSEKVVEVYNFKYNKVNHYFEEYIKALK